MNLPLQLPATRHLSRTPVTLASRHRAAPHWLLVAALALTCAAGGYVAGQRAVVSTASMQTAHDDNAPAPMARHAGSGLMRLPLDDAMGTLQFAPVRGGEWQRELEAWQQRLRRVQQDAPADAEWPRALRVSSRTVSIKE